VARVRVRVVGRFVRLDEWDGETRALRSRVTGALIEGDGEGSRAGGKGGADSYVAGEVLKI